MEVWKVVEQGLGWGLRRGLVYSGSVVRRRRVCAWSDASQPPAQAVEPFWGWSWGAPGGRQGLALAPTFAGPAGCPPLLRRPEALRTAPAGGAWGPHQEGPGHLRGGVALGTCC